MDGVCNLDKENGGIIQTFMMCPNSYFYQYHGTSHLLKGNDHVYCSKRLITTEPCTDCDAKGNPIHPGTGQKLQVETDYVSPTGGLEFTRTYRSTNGFFTSIATTYFVDNSLPAILTGGCYPGTFTDPAGIIHNYCFPYLTNNTQTYRLFTPEGRYLNFSGPANAIVAKADVNTQISQRINASGAIEWVIQNEDNSTSIYSAQGLLLRKTSLGGRPDISYSYSDAATSPSIAPRPGLLIRMSDEGGGTWTLAMASWPAC